jgi:cytochrome c oxidase cbb3-type subunit 1
MGVNKTPWWKGEYSSTRVWLVGEAVWFAIGTTAGLGGAIHPVAPDFFTNIPSLEFGRIRQFHVNTVLFGFVTAMLIGGGLYIVSRVLKRRLYSEATANLGALLFNSAALIGGIGILTGRTQGREYAEYVCSVDWLIVIAFILMGIVTVMTIVRREENLPYTSA